MHEAFPRKLWEKTRVKGMPHNNTPFEHRECIRLEDMFPEGEEERKYYVSLEERYQMVKDWFASPYQNPLPTNMIGKRIYMYQELEEEVGEGEERKATCLNRHFATHINCDLIEKVMSHSGELVCFFGTMKKSMINEHGGLLQVKPTVLRRVLCKNNWWASSKRLFFEGDDQFTALSYPPNYSRENCRDFIK